MLIFGSMVCLRSGLLGRSGLNLFRVFGLENRRRCGLFEGLLEPPLAPPVGKSPFPLKCQELAPMRDPMSTLFFHAWLRYRHLGISSMTSSPDSSIGSRKARDNKRATAKPREE